MKNKSKITIIIILQIGLIVGSFSVLAILESQNSLLGNSVNVAGKNRYLASQFLNEVKDWAYVKNPYSDPSQSLDKLEENVLLLKNGGNAGDFSIKPIDEEFEGDWQTVQENLIELELVFQEFKGKTQSTLSYDDILNLEAATSQLVESSDNLVQKLGNHSKIISERAIYFQISLLGVNVFVHLLLIFIIIRIFKTEYSRNIKLQKLAIIGEFSSILAHDLKTPLTNINMSLHLLKRKITKKSEKEKLEFIENSLIQISHQINDVLNFVKTKKPNLKYWKLNHILENCIQKLSIPNTVKIILPPDDHLINCDKEQFEILFMNIILNALESINEKGFLKINCKETRNHIIISIEDSGEGIPIEYVSNIFEPLFSLKKNGTGLGLASCKNIIESHGGQITAINDPTTFIIKLPKYGK